jgi:hypothetical protein
LNKRYILMVGLLLLAAIGYVVFEKVYYWPPDMDSETIKEIAYSDLKEQAPQLLQDRYQQPYKKEFSQLEILDVRELEGKTYLVFKLDYEMVGGHYDYIEKYDIGSRGYLLGLRLVEKTWKGITLKPGMEFQTSYVGVGPVDCGYHPDQGIFYGYCKDPRTAKAVLGRAEGDPLTIVPDNRVFMAAVPRKITDLDLHFFNDQGIEMEMSYNLRVAFVTEDSRVLEQYTNTPLEWWTVNSDDLPGLSPDAIDAVWIFPDQYRKTLNNYIPVLKQLALEGIPVLFIGATDTSSIVNSFSIEKPAAPKSSDPVEALYIASEDKNTLAAGLVLLNDTLISPLVETSMALKYQQPILLEPRKDLLKGPDNNPEAESIPITKSNTSRIKY